MATAPTTLPNVGTATGRTWWPLATCTRGSGRRARGTARGGTCLLTAATTATARRPLDWGPPGWCQCYPSDRWRIPKSLQQVPIEQGQLPHARASALRPVPQSAPKRHARPGLPRESQAVGRCGCRGTRPLLQPHPGDAQPLPRPVRRTQRRGPTEGFLARCRRLFTAGFSMKNACCSVQSVKFLKARA